MTWLEILRTQVASRGQRAVAEQLGISNAVVSLVVNEKYTGDMQRIQKLVESVFLALTVKCPVLGDIGWHTCQQHQQNHNTGNPQRLRLYRACRSGCPHSDLAVTQNVQLIATEDRSRKVSAYDAETVITRLKRQTETDGGGVNQLNELLQSELKSLATKFNRLQK